MKRVLPLRIPVYIKAELISGSKKYPAIIGNFSEKGAFVETGPTKSATLFLPGKKIKLRFTDSPKNSMDLNCEVIWLYTKKLVRNSVTNSLGLEIKKPSSKYSKYFQDL
ncbi:MAG: PilZ domain-containing protein [Nitrospirota bacterium]